MLQIKRIYEEVAESDGYRVLIDRLWPRGITKEKAAVDWWAKELAPSTELRKWFGHRADRWSEFKQRYAAELDEQGEALARLRQCIEDGEVTICYAAKNTQHNNAMALTEMLGSTS